MTRSIEYFQAVLNSVTEHIAVVDTDGIIECVNTAWVGFGIDNGSTRRSAEDWVGVDYFEVCDAPALAGEGDGPEVAEGLRRVIDGRVGVFSHEYPCHSSTERRWFMMRVTPLVWDGPAAYVISHHNITGRKLAEERVQALSLQDGLTGLPNRRRFDAFATSEWRRGRRERAPVSLLLIDIDHFKLYNDRYGHTVGDECLQRVAKAIGGIARRPSDLSARYGGEEFVVVLGGTDAPAAYELAVEALEAVTRLGIPHDTSPTSSVVTVSVGVATMIPDAESDVDAILKAADEALYAAKGGGRHRVAVWTKGREP